ncbi:Fic family protein [Hydrogenovibrio halophilus]|uniref:Fic family protein n=1 Tax=Hydrogenovibrio halophilus TaxID=373391 RepID=UPI0003634F52|nr:Fic family protein [Hydrogenovibrio halophilus]
MIDMDKKAIQNNALSFLKNQSKPVTTLEIHQHIQQTVSERTLRRWLADWQAQGLVERLGHKRGTRYQYRPQSIEPKLSFLQSIPKHRRQALIHQIRDVWTHSSTALEGNTFTLGDTSILLEQGLTISGKPIKEHQEILGHAKAIDLIYQFVSQNQPIDKAFVCRLHLAVQTENVLDIYKPMGDWKVEPNGTNAVDKHDRPVYIEYAHPLDVEALMNEFMEALNGIKTEAITPENAPQIYAGLHMGFVHIHPFWDGNGRLARLIANIPLLKAGLPPLVIDQTQRVEYIRAIADYQIKTGKLTSQTGVWPDNANYQWFEHFCQSCYQLTQKLIDEAKQAK